MTSSASSSSGSAQLFSCPFCGLRDADSYALHFHIESTHTPDSPFVTAEEKGLCTPCPGRETGYVLCPEPSCGDPVLRIDLQTHLDMHLAERVALTELGDDCGPFIETGSIRASKSTSKGKRRSHKPSGSKSHRSRRKGLVEVTIKSEPSSSSKKARRLGTSELGPYAMEQQMPPDLYNQLAAGPPISYHMEFGPNKTLVRVATVANETPNLIPVIAKLCEKDPNVAYAWLCHDGVRHIGKQLPREGGFCGYRNIQMMISYLQSAHFEGGSNPFPGMVPSIIKLQEWIEAGWEMGINDHGKIETGGIKGTRKYIGTSEAETLFVSRGVTCGAKHLTGSDTIEAHEALLDFVENYYEKARPSGPTNRILQTRRPPIYFQHSGHSMTIVGLEVYQDGSRSLLVFDPSFSPSPGIRDLVGAKRIGSKIDGTPLLKLHRRGTQYLQKYKEFELLTVQANPRDTDILEGLHLNPFLKRTFGWPFGRR